MVRRVINFSPGPAVLPLPALEQAQRDLLDFRNSGMSILEHSHRGSLYGEMHVQAISLLSELLGVPDTHQVLFLQGGAHQQFALIPLNSRTDEHAGAYVITGMWAQRAFEEAQRIGPATVAADTQRDGTFTRVPRPSELVLSARAPYLHITSNNTLYGTQYQAYPPAGSVPLIADMSSDLMSRPLDVSQFGLIYACAQKNLGCAGVTVVIVRKSLLEHARSDLPKIFRYATHAKENSLYNTAPTFAVYMLFNVLNWLKASGGLTWVAQQNAEKAGVLYDALDTSADFYRNAVERDSRSQMNVVFRLPSAELERAFVGEAEEAGLFGLKGHRAVGGIRASIYNAMTLEGVEALVTFMREFRKKH
jgi:phosphoserine aminotransferase